jgi:hypothetical protein
MTNEAAPRFFNCFIDLAARLSPRNLLHLMFDPAGMRPFIANWDDAAEGLLARVYRESVGRVIDEKTKELLAVLLAYPDVKAEWKAPRAPGAMPVIPLGFIKDDKVLNYFSMVTTVGTPRMIAAQELRIECMFPADDVTDRHHAALMEQVSGTSPPVHH